MKTIAVSKFKATCIASLKKVQKDRTPLLVTWRGKTKRQTAPV